MSSSGLAAQNTVDNARLLVVSRESALLRPLWSVAEPNCWQVEVAPSAWDAIERVQSGTVPHLLVLDLPRGDGDCLHSLRWLRRLHPDLPVVVICWPKDAGRKREAMQLGAYEVLIRPFEAAQLEAAIQRNLPDQSGPKSLRSLIQNVKCEAERNAIAVALHKTGWNRKAAARLLQVSYRSLLYKIGQYHMSASESLLSPVLRANFPSAEVPKTVEPDAPNHENAWKRQQRSKP